MTENRFSDEFDAYTCSGNTIKAEIDGFTITARIVDDEHNGPIWEEHDGHGPVETLSKNYAGRYPKRPGQLRLDESNDWGRDRCARFYDYQEACKIALRDGWGSAPYDIEGETPRQKAARAARADFEYLRAWCRGEVSWVGVALSVSRSGITIDRHAASVWGIECGGPGFDGSYLTETANELLDEALEAGRAALATLCQCQDEDA